MDELFRACQWDDILAYIDSRTDPNNPGNWFTDRPQSTDQNTSVFNFKENGWDKYRRRLLEHLARDPRLFSLRSPFANSCPGNLWEWFASLNELSSIMFYCVVSTWGGGARGTECDHLKFEVDGQGARQIFILNGLVTVSTTYVKTASIQGHGKLIARCPSHSASRLLLVVLGVIYPAAAELATFVMSVEKAKSYLSYVFIQDGVPMNTRDFSQAVGAVTQRYLGRALGMRDWRQLMSTMLVNISKVDFGIVDEEDAGLLAIHDAFGHSQSVAEAHYALQSTNALTEISHTAVSSMQRVSKRWHATIEKLFDRLLGPLKTTIHNATQKATVSMGVDIVDELRNVTTGLGSSILREMNVMFHQYIHALGITPKTPLGIPPGPSLPRLSVHPNLIERLRPLFPGQPSPSFTSAQQAEVVQSCLTGDHVVCVMPTGSGKSLAFFAAPILIPDSLFIVVTPLVALTEDLARRLSSTTIPGGQYHHVRDVLSAQIIIVSAHQAGTDDFYRWANSISYRLKRVFIDEAHHVFTSDDYRPCFKLFHLITRLKKPITFLTATMAPLSLSRLCAEMAIPPSMVRVIRAPLHRPNIHYSVIKTSGKEVIQRFTDIFRSTTLNANDRGIIYCTRIDLIKELSQALDIPYYTSKVDDSLDESANTQEKKQRFQAWRDGSTPKHRWMIATLCFGEGIDFPGVRVVIHLEVNNMLRFMQETGRLGRDGLPSSSVLIYSKLPMYGEPQRDEHLGVLPMREFLQTEGCRRLTFQHFDPDAHSCSSITGTLLCDNCQLIKNVRDQSVSNAGVRC
ncbi:P-loop containing nucleoside triphosphate hydrolase protein [Suillus brevipes Sb2]|nr:P-loop containing nucleoside triphosphate hydrolase protein [Suillus brevipes Sb2]